MPQNSAIAHVAASELAAMIDPVRSALLLVDVQVDFASPAGAMARVGADLSGAPAVMERIAELVASARRAGACVAFAKLVTRPQTDSGALKRLNARKGHAPEAIALCREGEAGSGYYQVSPLPGDVEAQKRLYDAFHDTNLEAQLRERRIDTLVVAGFTTHCCVESTCRAAFHRDFNVFVVSDATGAYDSQRHYAALHALRETCALVTDTASVVSAWRQAGAG
jgi:nicotinamidase-related amidase